MIKDILSKLDKLIETVIENIDDDNYILDELYELKHRLHLYELYELKHMLQKLQKLQEDK